MDKVLFSKNSDDWATPKDFYDKLNSEFNFNFDPCPLNANFDGLNIDWSGNVYINPPYSNIKGFLEKAREELNKNNCSLCVFLIPSRTDTKWFHEYIYICVIMWNLDLLKVVLNLEIQKIPPLFLQWWLL